MIERHTCSGTPIGCEKLVHFNKEFSWTETPPIDLGPEIKGVSSATNHRSSCLWADISRL